MRLKNAVVIAVAAGGTLTCGAIASPRESVTFTSVASRGHINGATNAVRTAVFAGSDAGGPYTTTFLRLSGQWTRNGTTYSAPIESAVLVTPPSGTPFIAVPARVESTNNTPLTVSAPEGSVAIPVSPVQTAGVWTFRFFELNDDVPTDPDSTWDSVTFTLDDGPLPMAPLTSDRVASLSNLNVDRSSPLTPVYTYPVSFAPGFTATAVRVRMLVTPLSAMPNGGNSAPAGQGIVVMVTQPGGGTTGTTLSPGVDSVAEGFAPLPSSGDSGGPWSVYLIPSTQFPGIDAAVQLQIGLEAPPPPVAETLTPSDGTWASWVGTLGTGEVKWLTFDLTGPVSAAQGSALDIDAQGTQGDPTLLLYSLTGRRLLTDSDDGAGRDPQFSFGTPNRQADGDALSFDGRDGSLPASRYYLALTNGFPPLTEQPFGVSPTVGAPASAAVRLRYFSHFVPTPPPAEDLGIIGPNTQITRTFGAQSYEKRWFRFELTERVSPLNNRVLEIDTTGSTGNNPPGGGMYSQIALYDAHGGPYLANGNDFQFDGGLAYMTFGIGDNPTSLPPFVFDGHSGTLEPGVYYLGLMADQVGSWQNDFVGRNGPSTANFQLAVRSFQPSIDVSSVTPPASELVTLVPGITTRTAQVSSAAPVKWYRFVLSSDVLDDGDAAAVGRYLDIDSSQVPGGPTISNLALYTSSGLLLASDGFGGPGSFGALSFGDHDPVRPGAGGDSVVVNGRHGPLTAGTYYLAVLNWLNMFKLSGFDARAATTITPGGIAVHFSTNVPAGCGPADVGSVGGAAAPDNALNNNDFIAFINLFFAADPRADFGRAGGQAGSDSAFDNNDFIAFINAFFAGC